MWRSGTLVLMGIMGLCGNAAAQGPAAYLPSLPPPTHAFAITSTPISPLRSLGQAKSGDRAVTGILVGGTIGLVLGYVMYNGLCEAVNNQCSDSRVPMLMLGAVVGGAIGGIVGSLSGDD